MDNVNQPAHYTDGGIECIEALESALKHYSGVSAFCAGNIIKYIWRAPLKNGVEDVDKAIKYGEFLKRYYEKETR